MEQDFFEALLAEFGGISNVHCLGIGSGRLFYINEVKGSAGRQNFTYNPTNARITITTMGQSKKTSDVPIVTEHFHVSAVETVSFWP